MTQRTLTAGQEAAFRDAVLWSLVQDSKTIMEHLGLESAYGEHAALVEQAREQLAAQVAADERRGVMGRMAETWERRQATPIVPLVPHDAHAATREVREKQYAQRWGLRR